MEGGKRITAVFAVAAVALLVLASVLGVAYLDANARANDNQQAANRLNQLLEMNYPVLEYGQATAQAALADIGSKMENLSAALRLSGLNGTFARRDMNIVISSSDYLIDIFTMNQNSVVVACEPSPYNYVEGRNFTENAFMQAFLLNKMPAMTNVFLSLERVYGAALIVPVFGAEGAFLGGVCTLIDINMLVQDSIGGVAAFSGCSFDCVQKDGLIVSSDVPGEVSLNVLTSPQFDNYTELRALVWRMVNQTSGYGSYTFPPALGQTGAVVKDMFWVSFGYRGIEWRLAVQHAA